jgi:hypothetical protein
MVMLTRGLAVIGVAVVVAFPVGVAAADVCTYPATCVPGIPIETTTQGRPGSGTPGTGAGIPASITPSSEPVGAPATGATSPVSGASLPVTGGDIVGLTLLGAGAIAVGSVLSRRRGAKA